MWRNPNPISESDPGSDTTHLEMVKRKICCVVTKRFCREYWYTSRGGAEGGGVSGVAGEGGCEGASAGAGTGLARTGDGESQQCGLQSSSWRWWCLRKGFKGLCFDGDGAAAAAVFFSTVQAEGATAQGWQHCFLEEGEEELRTSSQGPARPSAALMAAKTRTATNAAAMKEEKEAMWIWSDYVIDSIGESKGLGFIYRAYSHGSWRSSRIRIPAPNVSVSVRFQFPILLQFNSCYYCCINNCMKRLGLCMNYSYSYWDLGVRLYVWTSSLFSCP